MSELKIEGKLIRKLEIVSGKSNAGKEWRKQDIVVETGGQYPKKIAITFFGDKIEKIDHLEVGQNIDVFINLESREYNGNWYTNVNGWKVESVQTSNKNTDIPPPPPMETEPEPEDVKDMPF